MLCFKKVGDPELDIFVPHFRVHTYQYHLQEPGNQRSNCRTLHAHGGHSEKPEDQNGIDRNVAEQGTQIYHRCHNDPFHTSHNIKISLCDSHKNVRKTNNPQILHALFDHLWFTCKYPQKLLWHDLRCQKE